MKYIQERNTKIQSAKYKENVQNNPSNEQKPP